jgi:guanylate kinase
LTVFLAPESLEVLETRLNRRAQDSAEVIRRRLEGARRELAEWPRYDYVIVTTTIPEDLRRMRVILEAEKLRASRTEIATP